MCGAAKEVSTRSIASTRRSRCSYRPPVIHQNIEDTQDHDQDNRTPLGLEAHRNHHTRHQPNANHDHPSETPIPGKHKPDEKENQQHSPSKLEIHLAILFVDLWQAGGRELLPHPAVGEDHEQAAHDAEVAQEEVEVEDEAVAEGLGHDDASQPDDGVFAVFADDDEDRAGGHGDDVENEEEVCYPAGNCDTRLVPTFPIVSLAVVEVWAYCADNHANKPTGPPIAL